MSGSLGAAVRYFNHDADWTCPNSQLNQVTDPEEVCSRLDTSEHSRKDLEDPVPDFLPEPKKEEPSVESFNTDTPMYSLSDTVPQATAAPAPSSLGAPTGSPNPATKQRHRKKTRLHYQAPVTYAIMTSLEPTSAVSLLPPNPDFERSQGKKTPHAVGIPTLCSRDVVRILKAALVPGELPYAGPGGASINVVYFEKLMNVFFGENEHKFIQELVCLVQQGQLGDVLASRFKSVTTVCLCIPDQ